jgi:hypothetical protein
LADSAGDSEAAPNEADAPLPPGIGGNEVGTEVRFILLGIP